MVPMDPNKHESGLVTITPGCFVELDFTATADGKVFDTTNPTIAKENALEGDAKPLIVPIGFSKFSYLPKGLEEFLLGKKIGKYKTTIPAEKAFGNKIPGLLRLYSLAAFKSFDITPEPGLTVNIDGNFGIIKTVSSGRVLVDFNHPLAGKEVFYDLEVKRVVDDITEKVKALIRLHGLENIFTFRLSEKKLFVTYNQGAKKPIELMDRFKVVVKDLLDLELLFNDKKLNVS